MQNEQYPEIGSLEVRRKIGEELRSAREFSELSIEQLAGITKINIKYIESIEKGKWAFLPPTYIKAFIISQGKIIGINPIELEHRLNELFANALESQKYERQIIPGESAESELDIVSSNNWFEQNRAIVIYGAIGVAAIVVISLLLFNPSRSPERIAEQLMRPGRKVAQEKKPSTAVDTSATDSDIQQKPVKIEEAIEPETWEFVIYATDTCYVKIVQEDSTLYERTLWPNNRIVRDFSGKVKVTLGNANGVRLIVEGDTLPAYNSTRRFRVVNIDEDGLTRQ